MNWFTSRQGRMWLYGIALAIGGLALIYGIVTGEQLAGWLAVIAAILGVASPAMAITHMTPYPQEPDDLSTVPDDVQ